MRRLALVLVLPLALAVAGCIRDTYEVRNPETGATVSCHSGKHFVWDNADPDEARVSEDCIRACERYGYLVDLNTDSPWSPVVRPRAPTANEVKDIPAQCLP